MRVSEACILTLKNTSYSVLSDIVVGKDLPSGMIITQGGLAGGWGLYFLDGKLTFCFNFFG